MDEAHEATSEYLLADEGAPVAIHWRSHLEVALRWARAHRRYWPAAAGFAAVSLVVLSWALVRVGAPSPALPPLPRAAAAALSQGPPDKPATTDDRRARKRDSKRKGKAATPASDAAELAPPAASPQSEVVTAGSSPSSAGRTQLATQHYRQANRYLAEKNAVRALEELEKCLAIDPTYGVAYRSLGVANMLLGREKSAIDAYARFVELEPGHRDAESVRQIIAAYRERRAPR